MGQALLANQFVSGLKHGLKTRLMGQEGTFEQLLVKARFEEARHRELYSATSTSSSNKKTGTGRTPATPQKGGSDTMPQDQPPNKTGRIIRPCFNCGMVGHLARECPYPRPTKGDKEAHGKETHNKKEKSGKMGQVIPTSEPQKTTSEQRVHELRRMLREAEVDAGLEETVNTMRGVMPSGTESSTEMGPTISITVHVNGVETDALVDTGSPVSIMSLSFAMDVLSEERSNFNTPREWKEAMLQRFEHPTIAMRSYGGERLNIVAQLRVDLQQSNHRKTTTVLVQKGAPHKLLIGTDVMSTLGFSLLLESDSTMQSLLSSATTESSESNMQGNIEETSGIYESPGLKVVTCSAETTKVSPQPDSEVSQEELINCDKSTERADKSDIPEKVMTPSESLQTNQGESTLPPAMGTVRLLQTTKVPAGFKKMVHTFIETRCPHDHDLSLFTPCPVEPGLVMEEAAVKVDGGKAMTLVIENCNHHAVWLQKGTELGTLQSVSIVDGEEAKPEAPYIAAVTEEGHLDGRFQQLLSALNLQLEHLSLIERKQLLNTLEANTDVFALDATELGTTEIVSHKIDTGEKQPIKQGLRRIPFSLRKKVDEMITQMLSQGVIAESRSPWASPIVLVRKKDGDLRFCVDYRKLNQNTKLDVFPRMTLWICYLETSSSQH